MLNLEFIMCDIGENGPPWMEGGRKGTPQGKKKWGISSLIPIVGKQSPDHMVEGSPLLDVKGKRQGTNSCS